MITRLGVALAGALLLAPTQATAQAAGRIAVTAGLRAGDLQTGPPGAETRVSGLTTGGGVWLRVWRVGLAASYEQGRLDATGDPGLDVVQGSLAIAVQPLRWIQVQAGPKVRALVRGGGTERWVLWTGEAQGQWHLVGDAVTSYAAAWQTFGATLNTSASPAEGRGVRGGLQVRLGRWPVALRAGFEASQLRLADGTRRETFQGFSLEAVLLVR